MARLNRIWWSNTISFASLVTSILLLNLLAHSEKKDLGFQIQVPEETSLISYLERKSNDWVWSKINFRVGPQELLLATIKRWKPGWFGHVTRHDSLSKTILQGTLEGRQCCGWQRKFWLDDIEEWTSLPLPELFTMASWRKGWKRISAQSSVMSPQ